MASPVSRLARMVDPRSWWVPAVLVVPLLWAGYVVAKDRFDVGAEISSTRKDLQIQSAENAAQHGIITEQMSRMADAITSINRQGTDRGQSIYRDMDSVKEQIIRIGRDQAAMEERLAWIMSSLERLERDRGLRPAPRPPSSSEE